MMRRGTFHQPTGPWTVSTHQKSLLITTASWKLMLRKRRTFQSGGSRTRPSTPNAPEVSIALTSDTKERSHTRVSSACCNLYP